MIQPEKAPASVIMLAPKNVLPLVREHTWVIAHHLGVFLGNGQPASDELRGTNLPRLHNVDAVDNLLFPAAQSRRTRRKLRQPFNRANQNLSSSRQRMSAYSLLVGLLRIAATQSLLLSGCVGSTRHRGEAALPRVRSRRLLRSTVNSAFWGEESPGAGCLTVERCPATAQRQ